MSMQIKASKKRKGLTILKERNVVKIEEKHQKTPRPSSTQMESSIMSVEKLMMNFILVQTMLQYGWLPSSRFPPGMHTMSIMVCKGSHIIGPGSKTSMPVLR